MKRCSPFQAESFRQSDAKLTAHLRGCQTVVGSNQVWDRHSQQLSYLKLRDLEFPGDVAALEAGREVNPYHALEEATQWPRELPRERRRAAEHTLAARIHKLAGVL